MNKKIISLVLALVMVLGTFTSVFAAETTEKKAEAKKAEAGEKVEKVVGKENKIQYIIDKKFVEGYEDGSYGYDKNIKRSEITRLLVIANGNEDLAKKLQGSMQVYSDVNTAHWANGVITVGTTRPSDANGIAMLAGYPDGSFKPERDVTYAELAKMLVVLVKKDLTPEMVKNAVWASSWMTWAAELGILDDVTVADSNKAANRADAFTMMYNALYKMQEFKRVPANETRGILSDLNNNKLVLNQDSKKEYKITADTVFVEGKGAREQLVKVTTMNNKEFYLGSLVRILVNDKNEVTHIIELGNPKDLAINNPEGQVKEDNKVWRGVADDTVETALYKDIVSLKGKDQKIDKEYATIGLKSDKTKADNITFHKANGKELVTLKITDKTEVYVANPYNNIMKEVSGINEALSLIGFHDYQNGYKIPNVYAGFDGDGLHVGYGKLKDAGYRNTAKVIVFNVVSKNQGGDLYRVIESSSSKFATTLEDTDGKLYDRDNMNNTSRFPLEYGDKLDVIEIYGQRSASRMETRLDHSATRTYPIVEVIAKDGNKSLTIKDINGEKSILDIRDADIFSAKRFDELRVGSKIQFVVENHKKANANNVAEIISILSRDTKLEGSIVGVLPSVDAAQQVGTIVEVNDVNGEHPTIVVKVDHNVFDTRDANGYATYNVSKDNARALVKYVNGEKLAFKVFKDMGWAGNYYAADFRINATDKPIEKVPDQTELTPVQKLVNRFYESELTSAKLAQAKEDIDNPLTEGTYAEKKAAKEEIQKYYDEKAKPAQKATDEFMDTVEGKDEIAKAKKEVAEAQKLVDALKDGKGKDNLQARIKAQNEKIADAEKALGAEEKQKAFDDYVEKITKALANVKVENNETNTVAEENDVRAAVKAELDKVNAPAGASYKVDSVNTTNNSVKVVVESTDGAVDPTTGNNIDAHTYVK
ncbi:hypothetical protein ABID14_001201 [Peptoniphilus olsenii]|uniref:SLH domain-containing protein n=1 Tax=Peptoniphilus olsenii TaxID=411570 RepID=A0ABV2J9V1_9FIRM